MSTKKHYKLYKSGKNWKTVAIMAATVAGVFSATTVTGNADVTNNSVATNNTTAVAVNDQADNNKSVTTTNNADNQTQSQQTNQTTVTTTPAKNGQVTENGATYYYENGQMKTDYFQYKDDHMYYYGQDGKMYQDKFYSNWGNMYYFGKDGARYTNQYYTNWGNTYYFGEGGVRYTDRFQSKDGKMYYYDQDGVQYRDKFYSNWGNMYYFGKDGARYTNQFYYNWGNMYYFGEDGVRYTNKFYENWGHKYYFGDGGVLAKNKTISVGGKTYTADNDGVLTEQTKWISPIAGVSLNPSSFAQAQRFGYDGGFRTNGFHDGLDFGSYDHPGSSIRAVAAGKVTQVGYTPGLEWYVTVDTGDYLIVYQEAFASRNNIAVKPGQWLNQGDFIGTRNTSHLHLGVTKQKNFNVALASSFSNNGTWLNPLDFF